jgi:hypothetical protein
MPEKRARICLSTVVNGTDTASLQIASLCCDEEDIICTTNIEVAKITANDNNLTQSNIYVDGVYISGKPAIIYNNGGQENYTYSHDHIKLSKRKRIVFLQTASAASRYNYATTTARIASLTIEEK